MKKAALQATAILMATAAIGTLCSCGGDDSESQGGNGNGNNGNNPVVTKAMTSDEAGDYLNTTADNLISLFNVNDQKQTITLASDFIDLYGDYDVPDEFDVEESHQVKAPSLAKTMRYLAKACTSDPSAASRAASEWVYTYNINPSDMRGIYEPNSRNEQWEKTGNSENIIFRFKHNGKQCEVIAMFSNNSWDVDYTYTDDDMWYKDTYNYYVAVPASISLVITEAGTTLVTATVESSFSNRQMLNVNSSITVQNLRVDFTLAATNTSAQTSQQVYVGSTCMLTSSANVNGTNLCDKDRLIDLANGDYDVDRFFTSGTAEANILGRVTVKAEVSKLADILDYCNTDYSSESSARKGAATLNNSCTGNVYFNSSILQATLGWQAYLDDESWGGRQYWGVEPILRFESDSSQFAFENYFDDFRFGNIADRFDDVYDTYERYW